MQNLVAGGVRYYSCVSKIRIQVMFSADCTVHAFILLSCF